MASLPNSKTVTYEEWLRMPEVTDAIEEVVNGEIRIMPPAKWKHHRIVELTTRELQRQIDPARYSFATGSFGLIIRKEPLTSRVPDLAVFELATLVEQDGYIHSAPQLLVEVLSPANTRREREEKLADYASIGVPEVWVISPEARTVEILLLQDRFLRSTQILGSGTLTPKLFPQVSVVIAKIWPD
jgi:Uma2 family endonuclease